MLVRVLDWEGWFGCGISDVETATVPSVADDLSHRSVSYVERVTRDELSCDVC